MKLDVCIYSYIAAVKLGFLELDRAFPFAREIFLVKHEICLMKRIGRERTDNGL